MYANRIYSVARVRVEHVFGAQSNDMGGRLVRSIGIRRAKANIGFKNLAYNMRRLTYLEGEGVQCGRGEESGQGSKRGKQGKTA